MKYTILLLVFYILPIYSFKITNISKRRNIKETPNPTLIQSTYIPTFTTTTTPPSTTTSPPSTTTPLPSSETNASTKISNSLILIPPLLLLRN